MKIFMHNEPIILVGGSKINSHLLKKIYKKHKIYAADSGANFLLSNEMDFEAVIGDMDSIDSQKLSYIKNEKKILISDQNTTDLQKCLSKINSNMFIGFGFIDLRLDHTLASLTAINREHSAKVIILVGEIDTVVWVKGKWSCALPIGTRLSIWPLGEQFFNGSSGLKYSLEGMTLHPLNLIGTSNETSENSFSLNPSEKYSSRYITIIPSKYFLNIYMCFLKHYLTVNN